VWTNTLPLQITHKQPEPDIIYSKLALALDSAQLSDPDQIVLCGDLADKELLEYLKKQYADETVSILTFPNIVINNESAELYDAFYFSQFALPIALAYKALYPDDGRWTLSNFLPHKTIEGQKTFKIAWHGIMILIAIFAIAFLGTIAILKINQEYSQAKAKKRDQDFTIARLRIEAAEIQKIRADLELQQKNIEVMRTLLENKNPWTHLLELINRKFAQKPVSWLTNLRLESGRLGISGNTTNRDNILEFAAILPNSEISKVTQSKIKDRSVWAFEIKSDLPSVDWIAIIEKDLEELIAFKEKFGEKQNGSQSSNSDAPGAPGTAAKARAANIKSSAAYKGLNPIAEKYIPSPTEAQVKKAGAALEDYNAFIAAINRGNMWEYRDLGVKFINNHADNALIPYIRWHLAYRMYLDKELNMVRVYTEPLMKNTTDALYPYALLVSARTDFVQGSGAYVNKYNILKTDYARHPLFEQIKEDLAIVGKAVTP
ncbi:MAG: hypothetical protein Q8J62_00320, partial [Candidatus Cloacimonadaceae bacterium]|nr:hypothetical protein [Candidatus Cloacimonadaceae bacterium]